MILRPLVRLVLSSALTLALALAATPLRGQTAPNIEEARLPAAYAAMGSRLAPDLLIDAVGAAANNADRAHAAQAAGEKLWRAARERVHQEQLDDRQLYWSRLAAKRAFRHWCQSPNACASALIAFESASRGMSDLAFEKQTKVRMAISGFDPFLLDQRIEQSNPSGVVALRLDDTIIHAGAVDAEIQAVVLPVRFEDFDSGLVEKIFEPMIESDQIHMLVTISMGRSQFDLERFPGRRRSASAPDNLNVLSGGSSETPLVPRLGAELLPGPEFVEFSLPVQAMQTRQGPYLVNDNRAVTTVERGELQAVSLDELTSQTAIRGGGGGYLSNEVSFRTVRLVRAHASEIIVGHIHTPRIDGYEPNKLAEIMEQIVRMLEAAVTTIAVGG